MLKIDSEFSTLVPPPSPEELALLEESILKHGCRVPLDVWNGFIVDGHTRYNICTRLKIGYKISTLKAKDRDEVREFIVKHAIGRRNLTPAQRVLLAEKLRPQLEADASARMKAGGNPSLNSGEGRGKVAEKIAAVARVSTDTAEKVKAIVAKGPLEVVRALSDGTMTVNAAHKAVTKPKEPPVMKAAPAEDAETEAPLSDAAFLAQKFKEHKQVRDLIGEIAAMYERFKKMPDEFTRKIHAQSFEAKIEAVKTDLRFSTPYAMCAYCSGDKCKACKMTGWQTKSEFNRSPGDMRRAQETR